MRRSHACRRRELASMVNIAYRATAPAGTPNRRIGVELDLKRVFQIARRWWWLLILGPLFGGVTAWYVSSQQPEMYASEVTLLIATGGSGANAGSVQASQNLTETYSQWAVTRPILERTADAMSYDTSVDQLKETVSAEAVPDTLFIRISARSHDPQEAATIANTVAEQFLLDVHQQTNPLDSQVRTDLMTQIEQTTTRLTEVQDGITTLTNDQNRTDGERDQLAALLNEEAQLQADLAQSQTTLRNLDVQLASAQTPIVILSPATPSTQPYAPNVLRATIIGTVAGIALTIAAAILLEYLDDTVRERDELVRITNVPVLAGVGTVPNLGRSSRLYTLDAPSSAAAEAMRLLRTNLEFASAPNPLKTLAISSAQPNDGKSIITANLGVVLAQAGIKTVIVDADLRHPDQHRIFGVENRRGLSTLLVSPEPNWREGMTALTIPNLALMSSGPIPPNPADLLSLDRFGAILSSISEWAEVVLIDTPPILAASDALIVATNAKGTLLVCRRGATTRTGLRQAIAVLQHAHVRVTGIVLNDARPNTIDHYGRYGDDGSATRRRPSIFFGRSLQHEHAATAPIPLQKVS